MNLFEFIHLLTKTKFEGDVWIKFKKGKITRLRHSKEIREGGVLQIPRTGGDQLHKTEPS